MAFRSLSKPQVAATVDSTAAQGHSHYWREGKDVKQAEGKIYTSGYTGISRSTSWKSVLVLGKEMKAEVIQSNR